MRFLPRFTPNAGGLASIIKHADGAVSSQLHVSDGDLILFADFDLGEFGPLFKDGIGLVGSDVFLVDGRGHSLTIAPDADIPPTMSIEGPNQTVYNRRLDAVRVLLVEDDEDMRIMVQAALEAAGAHVHAAASASQARRMLSENCPDVLISDIAMPDEDGYSLIRSLRASGVEVPAIALTAYARVEDAEEAKAAGFQVHLTKPVIPAHLIDTVADLALASQSKALALTGTSETRAV